MQRIRIKKTKYDYKNSGGFCRKPEWIVLHYTGTANASAKSCASSVAKSSRESSTHFVVDENDILACLPETEVAWHVGNGSCAQPDKDNPRPLEELQYLYCHDWRYDLAAKNHLGWKAIGDDFKGNKWALGVDMCVKKDCIKSRRAVDQDWYFLQATYHHAAALVAYLMTKYDIPLNHVIRHADATGKPCPRPFVTLPNDKFKRGEDGDSMWEAFLVSVMQYQAEGVEAVII